MHNRLCVDPLPINFERRTCLLLQEAVLGEGGKVVTFLDCRKSEIKGLSGIKDLMTQEHAEQA